MVGVWLGVETLCKAYLCHAGAKSEVSTLALLQHIVSIIFRVRVRVRVMATLKTVCPKLTFCA